jgi:hypothetical protein
LTWMSETGLLCTDGTGTREGGGRDRGMTWEGKSSCLGHEKQIDTRKESDIVSSSCQDSKERREKREVFLYSRIWRHHTYLSHTLTRQRLKPEIRMGPREA